MIRAKVNQLINKTLDGHASFNFNDFQLSVPSKNAYTTKINIKYEYDPQYFIEIDIPSEKTIFTRHQPNLQGKMIEQEYYDYKIMGSMSPGQLAYKESFTYEGQSSISKAINLWLNNLWEELTASPELRAFNLQKEEIEKIKAKVEGMPDEYFSVDEANDMKTRLDKLEKQFAQKLSEEMESKEAKDQIEKLHKEIETLKQTVHSLKKSGWFKSLITKTMTWLSDPKNQKLLKAGKDLVANMLPESKA